MYITRWTLTKAQQFMTINLGIEDRTSIDDKSQCTIGLGEHQSIERTINGCIRTYLHGHIKL
jgi:hypothetical protein